MDRSGCRMAPVSFVRVVYKCLMHSTVLADAVTKVNEVGTFVHVFSGAGNVGHRSTLISRFWEAALTWLSGSWKQRELRARLTSRGFLTNGNSDWSESARPAVKAQS